MCKDKEKTVIPVLDYLEIAGELQDIQHGEAFKSFAKKLGDGIRDVGFVYLINHDHLHEEDTFRDKSVDFFGLPTDVKEKYRKLDAVDNFHGFTSAKEENLGEREKLQKKAGTTDLKECFDFWGSDAHTEAGFPQEVPHLKEVVDDYRSSMNIIAKKILRAFAVYLELPDADFFIKNHKGIEDFSIRSHNVIRSNFYFPCEQSEESPEKEEVFRLGEHCDWGTFTLLLQDEAGGLEAKMANGDWIPVPPIKDSIVLNAGLMLEMWSGGNLPATPHRVRLLESSRSTIRQSLGYFIQPDGTSRCMPLTQTKADWDPVYPYADGETHYEYFRNRVLQSRANY